MKQLLLLLLLLPLLAALPSATGHAQVEPTDVDARLAELTGPNLCQDVLADTTVSEPQGTTPWRGYGSGWGLSTAQFSSSPQSLSLSASGAAAGQTIVITSELTEVVGLLDYFLPGPAAANDELRVRLYEVGNISASGLITTAEVVAGPDMAANSWTRVVWDVTDQASISRLRALRQATLVFSWVSTTGATGQSIWLDDLRAFTCVPPSAAQSGSLSGRVTQGAAGVPGVQVLLTQTGLAGVTNVALSTPTESDGTYTFPSVLALAPGESYRLWFLNRAPGASGLMGFWAGPRIAALAAGQSITDLNLDVAGITLLAPAPYGEVVASDAAPLELRWSGRSSTGAYHRVCLYDPERADPGTRLPLTYCSPDITPGPSGDTTYSLTPGSLPGYFGFTYGRSYRWYVEVYDRNPNDPAAQYGSSFAERAITLLSAPRHLPPEAMTPEVGDPAAGATADWTLLIYVAADNAIGDPDRAPTLGRPVGQLASLPELAAAYTRVNLVSYVDTYEPDGVELCYYPPGLTPDCRVRAEANTANPETLARFIAEGRQRYPAQHTALLIVSPGQAAGQLALDETAPGGPAMSLAGLDAAYQAAGLAAAKLDLVIYQAPLLGSVEVLQATAPYARYMVASAGQVWQLGPYRQLVPVLGGASRFDVAAVARATVTAYSTTVSVVGGSRATTWAAYDLGRAAALDQAVSDLADELRPALSSEKTVIRPLVAGARASAQSYDSSGNGRLDTLVTASGATVALEEDGLVDLRDLAEELRDAMDGPDALEAAVRAKAVALITLLDTPSSSPIIERAIRSGQSTTAAPMDLSAAWGLAVFFPGGDRLGGGPTLAESYHSADPPSVSAWAAMLRAYQSYVLAAGPGGVTQSAGGVAQFRPLPGGFVSTTLHMPAVWR